MQEGDVRLRHTIDGGEISVSAGITEMTGGFETAVYLSLFGGNEEDDGRPDNPKTWWGNLGVTDPAERYVSRLQNLLRALPAIPANLRRLEDAAKSDLQWLLDTGAASTVEVSASMPGLNRVDITVGIYAEGEESEFFYSENWKAMAAEYAPGPSGGTAAPVEVSEIVDEAFNNIIDNDSNLLTGSF